MIHFYISTKMSVCLELEAEAGIAGSEIKLLLVDIYKLRWLRLQFY